MQAVAILNDRRQARAVFGRENDADGLIPPNLSIDLWAPRVGTQRFYPPRLGDEPVPCFACGVDDRIVIVEQAVREKALFEI